MPYLISEFVRSFPLFSACLKIKKGRVECISTSEVVSCTSAGDKVPEGNFAKWKGGKLVGCGVHNFLFSPFPLQNERRSVRNFGSGVWMDSCTHQICTTHTYIVFSFLPFLPGFIFFFFHFILSIILSRSCGMNVRLFISFRLCACFIPFCNLTCYYVPRFFMNGMPAKNNF